MTERWSAETENVRKCCVEGCGHIIRRTSGSRAKHMLCNQCESVLASAVA